MKIVIEARNSVLPVERYGGMQRMAWHLGRALAALGHKVTFLCKKESVCNFAEIVAYNPSVSLISQIPVGTDIVHFNSAVPDDFPLPYVETIHGNYNASISNNAVFVSRNHAERFGRNTFVYNGIDWDDDEYKDANIRRQRSGYHFLGKAAWHVKNVNGAISIAQHLPNRPKLHILGGKRFNVHMGFRFTFDPRIVFHGMADVATKQDVMTHSLGLIFPVLWDEPFGLAVIESLYYGAPAFASLRGAMPEIVTPQVGFLSNDDEQLIDAICHANFSPSVCHDYATEMFNATRMAKGYIELYEKVLNGQKLC